MNKILIGLAIIASVSIIGGIDFKTDTVEAAGVQGPRLMIASSTTFTLTTSSQRLLATTTQPGSRVAATIQPLNCTTANSGVFMRLSNDVAATAATGLFAFASSTTLLGDHVNNIPVVQGAVQGIVSTGTCTVLVTEWRSTSY